MQAGMKADFMPEKIHNDIHTKHAGTVLLEYYLYESFKSKLIIRIVKESKHYYIIRQTYFFDEKSTDLHRSFLTLKEDDEFEAALAEVKQLVQIMEPVKKWDQKYINPIFRGGNAWSVYLNYAKNQIYCCGCEAYPNDFLSVKQELLDKAEKMCQRH